MPKEMLPILDKPLIQYGVEEAAGGCDALIVREDVVRALGVRIELG